MHPRARETTLRMTPPPPSLRSFHWQISIFAVLPFSPFYHSQMLYRVHRTALANNRPSGFRERTPLKVSTISRDNHRTAANSLMHMCTHRYRCIGLFTGVYACVRINIHVDARTRKGKEGEKTEKEYLSYLPETYRVLCSLCTRFFAQNCKTRGIKRGSHLNKNNSRVKLEF